MQITLTLRKLTLVWISLVWSGLVNPSWAIPNGLFYIADFQGEVKIQENSEGEFHQVFYGHVLNVADKIQLGAGASAQVQCSNLETWDVPTGKVSSIPEWCSGGDVLVQPNSNRVPSRNILDSSIPYIISPRGLVVSNLPKLHWNKVSDANSYQVKILEGSKEIWSGNTSDTEIIYSGVPPLERGLGYEIVVETDNGTSSRAEGTNGFRLLEESESQPIMTKAEKIKQQGLSTESELLALAYLYQNHKLNTEAIEFLEELVQKETQKTIIHRVLGDMYRQTGLNFLAKERYRIALALTETDRNLREKAAIQVGLAEAEYALGYEDKAVKWMKQAKQEYIVLGDELKQQELEQRIKYFLGDI